MSSTILKLDGGSGVEAIELFNDKYDLEGHPCWSSKLLYENKELVAEIHRRFIASGADVITTLSYQADPINLSKNFNISISEANELMAESVIIAKNEANLSNRKVLVAASIGPYGTHLADGSEYTGQYPPATGNNSSRIVDLYRARIAALTRVCQPDLLLLETVPGLADLTAGLAAVREAGPNCPPCWLSLCCPDGLHTAAGETLSSAVAAFVASASDRVTGLGINCAVSLSMVAPCIRIIREGLIARAAATCVVAYPNRGEVYEPSFGRWSHPPGSSDRLFCELVPLWLDEGLDVIGGCCRMGSDRMKLVYDVVDQWQATHSDSCI